MINSINLTTGFQQFFCFFYIEQLYETPRPDGNISRRRNEFDFHSSTMYSNFQIVNQEGEVEAQKEFYQRLYTPAEIKRLVEKAGFTVIDIYGGFKREKVSFNSAKIVILAVKKNKAYPLRNKILMGFLACRQNQCQQAFVDIKNHRKLGMQYSG